MLFIILSITVVCIFFFYSHIAKHMLETILTHYQKSTLDQTKMMVKNVDHSQTK